MPKRKFEVALAIGGEGSQEGKGCACQAVKADAEDYEVLQGAKKHIDSYLDVSQWASTHAYGTPPRSDLTAEPEITSFPTPLSSLHCAPLTEENLLAFNDTMPSRKGTGVGTTATSSVENLTRASQVLQLNHIFVDYLEGEGAEERKKEVMHQMAKIIQKPRQSMMSAAEAEDVMQTASELSKDDELTFMAGVWNLVIGKKRTVKDMNRQALAEYVERAWIKDNLKCNWSSHWKSGITPPLHFADPGMEYLLDVVPKLKSSYPDLTYGYNQKALTEEQLLTNETLTFDGQVCKKNWFPFLIGEAKSLEEPFEMGVVQAARAAATAIHLQRELKESAKPFVSKSSATVPHATQNNDAASSATVSLQGMLPGVPGPGHQERRFKADLTTIIFTFVISPEFARLYVAWAEEEWEGKNTKPGINYHMQRIRSCYFGEGAQQWMDLRYCLDNILDWGVGPKKTEVLNLLDDIANMGRGDKKRGAP